MANIQQEIMNYERLLRKKVKKWLLDNQLENETVIFLSLS